VLNVFLADLYTDPNSHRRVTCNPAVSSGVWVFAFSLFLGRGEAYIYLQEASSIKQTTQH
jgi:hypothetical protein